VKIEEKSWGSAKIEDCKVGLIATKTRNCTGSGIMGGETWPGANHFILILCSSLPKIH
jgi:hypothetical protein